MAQGPLMAGVYFGRAVSSVLPLTERALRQWERTAAAMPCPRLRLEALDSLRRKRFHCHGGAVLAAGAPRSLRRPLVEGIVAVQTISDYLDNLCDRIPVPEQRPPARLEADFRQLHGAFLAALTAAPGREAPPGGNYYAEHPYHDDGGYLAALVTAARNAWAQLPGWACVQDEALRLGRLYCELQSLKHLPSAVRIPRVQQWLAGADWPQAQQLHWWEQAAAAGSTLGIFALALRAAQRPKPQLDVLAAYDPWLAAFHILLDYLIDQAEDARDGELNFVAQYETSEQASERLVALVRRSCEAVAGLPDAGLHGLILRGLVALYLSDEKARVPDVAATARRLRLETGWQGDVLHAWCRLYRQFGVAAG